MFRVPATVQMVLTAVLRTSWDPEYLECSSRSCSSTIPVLIRSRRNRVHSAHGVNQANLLSVSRQLQTAPGAPLISTKLALVNIRPTV